MATGTDRRAFIASAVAAAGTLALPGKVFAQPIATDARGTRILEIARREVARADAVLWRRDIAGIAVMQTIELLPINRVLQPARS